MTGRLPPRVLRDEYPDNNKNGIPDAFENRESIVAILRQIYGDDLDTATYLGEHDTDRPMFTAPENIWIGEDKKPRIRSDKGKRWLIIGQGQSIPLAEAKLLGIVDDNGILFYEKRER